MTITVIDLVVKNKKKMRGFITPLGALTSNLGFLQTI